MTIGFVSGARLSMRGFAAVSQSARCRGNRILSCIQSGVHTVCISPTIAALAYFSTLMVSAYFVTIVKVKPFLYGGGTIPYQ